MSPVTLRVSSLRKAVDLQQSRSVGNLNQYRLAPMFTPPKTPPLDSDSDRSSSKDDAIWSWNGVLKCRPVSRPGSGNGNRLPPLSGHVSQDGGSRHNSKDAPEVLFCDTPSRRVAWSPMVSEPADPKRYTSHSSALSAILAADEEACACEGAAPAEMAETLRLRQPAMLIEGGRSFQDYIERRRAGSDGLSLFDPGETARLRQAFRRFKARDGSEVNRSELPALLAYLGYLGVSENRLDCFARQVTEYNTISLSEFTEILMRYAPEEPRQLLRRFNAATDVGTGSTPSSPSKFITPSRGVRPRTVSASSAVSMMQALESPALLSQRDLPQLMRGLGTTPRTEVIAEVLAECGLSSVQELTWEFFLHFVTAYQSREGFLADEISRASRIFHNAADARGLSAAKLADALTSFFGQHTAEEAQHFAERTDAGEEGEVRGGTAARPEEALSFSEFVVCARTLRESLLDGTWRDFCGLDTDRDGLVSGSDLVGLVPHTLGLTLLQSAAEEFLAEAAGDDRATERPTAAMRSREAAAESATGRQDCLLDFDASLRFLARVRQREGFSHAEVEEFKAVFHRFDSDNSGEIESIELLEIMRFMGHCTSLETVHDLIKTVDLNCSGGLDFTEFLKLMRQHRELEIKAAHECFEMYSGDGEVMDVDDVQDAVMDFGWNLDLAAAQAAIRESNTPQEPSFEDFFVVMQTCRRLFASERRKMSGFSVKDVEFFEGLFKSNGHGAQKRIDWAGFERILGIFGVLMSNLDKRREVFEALEEARVQARSHGVSEDLLGGIGDQAELSMPLGLHLIRVLGHNRERASVAREMQAIADTLFGNADVAGFREVFFNMLEHGSPLPKESPSEHMLALLGARGPDAGTTPQHGRRSSAPCLDAAAAAVAAAVAAAAASSSGSPRGSPLSRLSEVASPRSTIRGRRSTAMRSLNGLGASRGESLVHLRSLLSGPLGGPTLSFVEICNMLKFLGLKPTQDDRVKLAFMIRSFTADSWLNEGMSMTAGCVDPVRDVVDFPAFLRLMHWMSKVNFAQVNEAVSTILGGDSSSRMMSRGASMKSLGTRDAEVASPMMPSSLSRMHQRRAST